MSLFDGISEKEIESLKELLDVHIYNFHKGEEIKKTISSKNIFGFILEGSAKLILNDYKGDEVLLEEYNKGALFGTLISDINNFDTIIVSQTDVRVAVVRYEQLFDDRLNNKVFYTKFIKNLFELLIKRNNDINLRLRILTKKTIRDRLIEFFNIKYESIHNKTFDIGMPLKDLADYLAINRSAMFRELNYLKEDNLIKLDKHKITLLY